MKIITCFKLVSEEQDIVVTPEYTLNPDNADTEISQSDFNITEVASQLATDDDKTATLTVSDSLLQNSKVCKGVLSRKPHSLYMMQGAQFEHALPLDTAKALATAVKKTGSNLLISDGDSGGLYTQQVDLLVGELLQLPVINAMSAIQHQGNTLMIERTFEDDVEATELSILAVLCVASDISVPRTPSMKATPSVGKRPVDRWRANDTDWSRNALLAELTGIHVSPQTKHEHIALDNDPLEAIAELAGHLKKALN